MAHHPFCLLIIIKIWDNRPRLFPVKLDFAYETLLLQLLLRPGTKSGDLGLANYPWYLAERFFWAGKKEMAILKLKVTRICCEAEY